MGSEPDQRVIAVLPSRGLGGGIERYLDWVLESLADGGVAVESLALTDAHRGPSLRRKASFFAGLVRVFARARGREFTVVVGHPSLGVAALAALRCAGRKPHRSFLVVLGTDWWSLGRVERRLLLRSPLQPITISAYTAGSMTGERNATVLLPGLQPAWYDALVSAPRAPVAPDDPTCRVATVFRLEDARDKGAFVLMEAIERLRRDGAVMTLEIAGSGPAPAELVAAVDRLPWVTLHRAPTDAELAAIYAAADVFVLATRTRRSGVTGEGFGIVLAEAQLAGAPVVAPAFGGSSSAYVDGVTGVHPADESVDALALTLSDLTEDPVRLRGMGTNARRWARYSFEPHRRSGEVCDLMMGRRTGAGRPPLAVTVVDTDPDI